MDLASDKQASDIVLLDIRGVSLIADYFVICTVGSERQAAAILKDLSGKLIEEFGRKPLHTEGKPDSGWVLLDYGDVILHVFSPPSARFITSSSCGRLQPPSCDCSNSSEAPIIGQGRSARGSEARQAW